MRKVYITGVGLVTSIGNDVPTVFTEPACVASRVRTLSAVSEAGHSRQGRRHDQGFRRGFDGSGGLAVSPAVFDQAGGAARAGAQFALCYCAMLQAIDDARLASEDISNSDTGLYAASGGSPFLTHYHHARMNQFGVMRCSPLGIVASIAGHVELSTWLRSSRFSAHPAGFSSACAVVVPCARLCV